MLENLCHGCGLWGICTTLLIQVNLSSPFKSLSSRFLKKYICLERQMDIEGSKKIKKQMVVLFVIWASLSIKLDFNYYYYFT